MTRTVEWALSFLAAAVRGGVVVGDHHERVRHLDDPAHHRLGVRAVAHGVRALARERLGLLFDAEGPRAIGVNLSDSVKWVVTWLPVWSLPIGVLGAAAGARVTRRRSPH